MHMQAHLSHDIGIYLDAIGIVFLRFYMFLFLENGREKEGEKHQCVLASPMPLPPLPGDLAHNTGMCPDWESNQDPLVRRATLNPLSHTSQAQKPSLDSRSQRKKCCQIPIQTAPYSL